MVPIQRQPSNNFCTGYTAAYYVCIPFIQHIHNTQQPLALAQHMSVFIINITFSSQANTVCSTTSCYCETMLGVYGPHCLVQEGLMMSCVMFDCCYL